MEVARECSCELRKEDAFLTATIGVQCHVDEDAIRIAAERGEVVPAVHGDNLLALLLKVPQRLRPRNWLAVLLRVHEIAGEVSHEPVKVAGHESGVDPIVGGVYARSRGGIRDRRRFRATGSCGGKGTRQYENGSQCANCITHGEGAFGMGVRVYVSISPLVHEPNERHGSVLGRTAATAAGDL